MPKEIDDRVKELMSKPDFKASYDKLVETKKGFKEKFPTLESFAWARAHNERKKKAAEMGVSLPQFVRLTAGFVEDTAGLADLFSEPRVKKLLDKPAPERLNSGLVITELTQLETPSSHKGPYRYILTAENAEEMWAELIHTPVHWTPFMAGHFAPDAVVIGTVIDVAIDRTRSHPVVLAAIQLWDKDWPEIVPLVQEMGDKLGASWELNYDPTHSELRDEMTYLKKYHPTGMAILRRSRAAYPEMRVLAASADLTDSDFEPDATSDGTDGGKQDDPGNDPSGDGGSGSPGADGGDADANAAVWSTKFVNDLPDSSFALVRKPVKNKATDRALPYKDGSGKVDPAHVRNALARLSQVKGWSEQEKARAKAKLQRALKSIGGKPGNRKGASAMPELSAQLEAMLAQVPDDEARAVMRAALDAQAKEFEANAASAEALAERDKQIGELTAKVEDLSSKNTQLESEKTEAEKLRKVAEQKDAAEKEFSDFVAKKVYAEEDRETILPIIAKGKAGESLTYDEATTLRDRKLGGEADDLPGATPPGSSGTAELDDKELDKLRDAAADDLRGKGILRPDKKGGD
jgi:hypothetical protein